jgi:DNA-binding NtrC family response regulator
LNPDARIILMSGEEAATSEEKLAALQPRTVPLLKKPFALNRMIALIEQAMTR